MFSNILLSRLSPYIDEIIGDHQCGFRGNRPSTDHIFRIRQILNTKWNFKVAYDSIRKEVLYNILIESGVRMKLLRLVKMCLN
jgi:hypothetical protein